MADAGEEGHDKETCAPLDSFVQITSVSHSTYLHGTCLGLLMLEDLDRSSSMPHQHVMR